jgi:hypothetical protein
VTVPRQVIAGRSYLISRRATQRQFLLRPDPHVEQIFLYCLGEASARYEVTLHGWLAEANHYHALVRDNRGNLPAFLCHLNKMLAKCLNAYWGRWENLFASEQPSAVWLVEPEDGFEKLIYAITNPVKDGLVEYAGDWPGASSLLQHSTGRTVTVRRPRGFFRERGVMPETVTLAPERLEGFEALSQAEWAAKVRAAVRAVEAEARAERARTGRRVLGRKAVRRARPTDRPSSLEPRRRLRPALACRNRPRRIAELAALRAFRAAHRRARLRFAAGQRSVLFPPGTYRMSLLGARCLAARRLAGRAPAHRAPAHRAPAHRAPALGSAVAAAPG